MTTQEFIKKYHPITYGGLKQFSWDLFEEIEETFDQDLDFKTKIGSAKYRVAIALEVCDKELKDHTWLVEMYNDLKEME